jgi:hypothetical protein
MTTIDIIFLTLAIILIAVGAPLFYRERNKSFSEGHVLIGFALVCWGIASLVIALWA